MFGPCRVWREVEISFRRDKEEDTPCVLCSSYQVLLKNGFDRHEVKSGRSDGSPPTM